jgi:hypothetical protein
MLLRAVMGGDFFLKPAGLELFFSEYQELTFALFFLFFVLNI